MMGELGQLFSSLLNLGGVFIRLILLVALLVSDMIDERGFLIDTQLNRCDQFVVIDGQLRCVRPW